MPKKKPAKKPVQPEIEWATCSECGAQQEWIGENIQCDACGEGVLIRKDE